MEELHTDPGLDLGLSDELMGCSRVCLLTTIWGRPYNGDAADRASEAMWKKDGKGG